MFPVTSFMKSFIASQALRERLFILSISFAFATTILHKFGQIGGFVESDDPIILAVWA
jgi:hypothetical protein